MSEPEQTHELKIVLTEEISQGMYVNMALVNHSENEFTVDVMYMQPQEAKATVRARIISSPKHTKRLMLALQENLQRYEARFGAIDASGPAPVTDFFQ